MSVRSEYFQLMQVPRTFVVVYLVRTRITKEPHRVLQILRQDLLAQMEACSENTCVPLCTLVSVFIVRL